MNLYGFSAAYGHEIYGTFGASLVYMDNGELQRTIPDNSDKGYFLAETFNVNQFAVGIAYARQQTDKFSFGMQVKYSYQDLGPTDIIDQTVSGIDTLLNTDSKSGVPAFDFGTMYYFGYKDLRIAMNIRNFAPSVDYAFESFQLPLVIKIGVAMNMLSLWQNNEDHSLQFCMEASNPNDYSERVNIGSEYCYHDLLYLRSGYRFNYDEGGFSAGFGLSPSLTGYKVGFDYSYTDFGNIFGSISRMSLTFGF
jgi:hypothetical protein